MNRTVLTTTFAALLATLPILRAADEPKKEEPKKEDSKITGSVSTNTSGQITIEMDIDGKKERKTFTLGGDKPFVWNLDKSGKGGVSVAGQIFGAGKDAVKGQMVTWLGVAADPVSEEVRAQLPLQPGEGLAVRHVAPDGPAAKAGLVEHDIITRLDDQILVSSDQLRSLVKMRKPGESIKITYLRKGQKAETTASLVEHESEPEDVLRFLGSANIPAEARERIEEAQKRLRAMKDKVPNIIVDKKAFLIGPDGDLKKLYNEKVDEVVESLRKELQKVQTDPEHREEIRKKLEEALQGTREAMEQAKDLLKKHSEEPKKP